VTVISGNFCGGDFGSIGLESYSHHKCHIDKHVGLGLDIFSNWWLCRVLFFIFFDVKVGL
jgi:hypothetical protein